MVRKIVDRQRKPHTRSQTGCTTCKKRHVRCDEGRPLCTNCLVRGQACEYAAWEHRAKVQKKKTLPGEQIPWTLGEVRRLDGSAGDPFDCFPIEMPFRSRHLMHYFLALYNDHPASPINCISLASKDPILFRSLLLVTASYYAWNRRGLWDLEPTYLFHMSQCIRQLKTWLADPKPESAKPMLPLMKLTACLSISESFVGNAEASKTHLDGLITMLEIWRRRSATKRRVVWSEDPSQATLDELAERFTMVSFDFSTGMNTHRREERSGQFALDGRRIDPEMRQWRTDLLGHDERLAAARQILHFFIVPQDETETHCIIDATPSIEALRRTTELVEKNLSPLDPSVVLDGPTWTFGASASMMVSQGGPFVKDWRTPPTKGQRKLLVNKSTLDVLCGFVMYGVLGVGNGDTAVDNRFTRQVFEILKRDVELFEQDMIHDRVDRDFWLWKVAVGAHGIALIDYQAKDLASKGLFDMKAGGEETISTLKKWFRHKLRRWSGVVGVVDWVDARKVLQSIVWPENNFSREIFLIELWQEAIREV
ncbi:hypothetical protein GQ53DRAFT_24048 [Thozetella sp. PMI_491]|nr:hypothetical protein GQ53DRAFT_24048 [Thozetella sp. PMI_491]